MKNWYEESIKELIEQYFREHGYNFEFDSTKFFFDEINEWKETLPESEVEAFIKVAIDARNYAFNKKYGAYNYSNDYRSECLEWNKKFLSKILEHIKDLNGCKVLAMAANNGSELLQIFENKYDISFDVVEISKDAVELGRKLFPNINFTCASMDEYMPKEEGYDIYLNLRAMYCAGNDLDIICKRAYLSLKEGGIAIISISNGYIDVSNGIRKIVKGIYNPATGICSNEETNTNLTWVKEAILHNGFTSIEIYDVDSEILLISKK